MENIESNKEVKERLAEVQVRQAEEADTELMFRLQHLDGAEIDFDDSDIAQKYLKYKDSFEPSKIEVIQDGNESIGRLRVVRGDDIYIGGLQILPEYRGKGIGTEVLEGLIKEAEDAGKKITLEVFHNNPRAQNLYEKLGFRVIQENEKQKIMEYVPSSDE